MALTPTAEQLNCITTAEHNRITAIQASAGAGKTSTLVLMANTFVVPSIYLAFNKSSATEAAEKFPSHVECRTTHSMAYAQFGVALRDKLTRPKGAYVNVAATGGEIARYLKIQPVFARGSVVVSAAYMGLMVNSVLSRFEQSASDVITKDHLPFADLRDIEEKHKIKTDVISQEMLNLATRLWKDRIDVNKPVLATHDTYLKLWQLSRPKLHKKVIYVDEFQDTTECVLDIIRNQTEAKIVVVGDSRQNIYGWRGSINAMELLEGGVQCRLSKSFRYGQAIADIAVKILDNTVPITGREDINSVVGGFNQVDKTKPYTVLCRTNAFLLDSAIADLKAEKKVRIEIDTKDFLRVLESAKALYLNDTKNVKHERILPYNNWDEMVEESKSGGELRTLVSILTDKREDEIIRILSAYVKPVTYDILYTTSHKAKGLEYHQVLLGNDFPSNYNQQGEWVGLTVPEQNLLYVAATRAIFVLEYNLTVSEIVNKESADAV